MSTRMTDKDPSFGLLDNPKKLSTVHKEIEKFKPEVEVSIEGLPEFAMGHIVEWYPSRKFFVVQWTKKSALFDKKTESESGLRVFFKSNLFSTQVLFKSTTVRREEDSKTHYRIPEQIYQQQKRASLRVPIINDDARIEIAQGNFAILDLSMNGAKVQIPEKLFTREAVGTSILIRTLLLGKSKIKQTNFSAKIVNVQAKSMGLLFSEVTPANEIIIKQFLVEALRLFYHQGEST